MLQRPVKLKIWDKEEGKFFPLISVDQLAEPMPTGVIVQFTGVYDANGQEIWEGDILYWRYYEQSENKLYESWHEVVFRKGAFGTLDGDEDLSTFNDLAVGDVVVGNVFENPQMLKKPLANGEPK